MMSSDQKMAPTLAPGGYRVPLLTKSDLKDLRERHSGSNTRIWGPGDTYEVCSGCGQQTCDARRLLDYIDALETQGKTDD
jgi:hypothetical protein